MLFWPESRSDECHFLSLELSTLCYALMNSIVPCTKSGVAVAGATNAVNTKQSEAVTVSLFFPPHHPYPRAFCTLPSFAHIKRPRWLPVGLNDRHLRSNGKIGDCEQSSEHCNTRTERLERLWSNEWMTAIKRIKRQIQSWGFCWTSERGDIPNVVHDSPKFSDSAFCQ